MNPKYYVTPEEAKRVTDFLNKHAIGGGVAGGEPNVFVGPLSVPEVPGKEMLNLILSNGAKVNAGLVLDMMGKGYAEWLTAATLRASVQSPPVPKEEV